MPLKQPNLIIFKNLSLIDSLRGGERQRQKTKATTRPTTKAKDKGNDNDEIPRPLRVHPL
ncbi:MAG: hypothetical protein LBL00_09045 [Endomicrobium sp.]|jgi:hypothetical protein|nr:hypothetical protein [Endomicrobium sp.]